MAFLIGEILLYLFLALVLGAATGWILRGQQFTTTVGEIENRWRNRVEAAEALREKYSRDIDVLKQHANELSSRIDESEGKRELQLAEIASLRMDLSGFAEKDEAINQFRGETESLKQQLRSARDAADSYRSQLELKARETAEFRLQYEKARQSSLELKKKLDEAVNRIENLGDVQPLDTDTMASDLEKILAEREIEIENLETLLRETRQDAEDLKNRTAVSDSQRKALEAQLRDLQEYTSTHPESEQATKIKDRRTRRMGSGTIELTEGSPEAMRLRNELSERTRKYAVLEADYRTLKARYAELLDPHETSAETGIGEKQHPESATVDEPAPPEILLARPEGTPDDLKKIHGIGPVIERTLNELGVYHYRQIAALADDDIVWIARQIDSFPGRIRRDDWIGQARDLSHTETD